MHGGIVIVRRKKVESEGHRCYNLDTEHQREKKILTCTGVLVSLCCKENSLFPWS